MLGGVIAGGVSGADVEKALEVKSEVKHEHEPKPEPEPEPKPEPEQEPEKPVNWTNVSRHLATRPDDHACLDAAPLPQFTLEFSNNARLPSMTYFRDRTFDEHDVMAMLVARGLALATPLHVLTMGTAVSADFGKVVKPHGPLALPHDGTYPLTWVDPASHAEIKLLATFTWSSDHCNLAITFSVTACAGLARAWLVDLCDAASAAHNLRFPPRAVVPTAPTHIRTWIVRTLHDGSMTWEQGPLRAKRPLDTLYLPAGAKDGLFCELDLFMTERDDYEKHGIPYKRVILLSGTPGTGKTSCVWAAASKYDKVVALLTATPNMTNEHLGKLLLTLPTRSVYVLLEEVDCLFEGRTTTSAAGGVTFSQLLTMLDGLNTPDGCVIFLTTNHRNRLTDEAFGRACRIDSEYTFGYMARPEVEAALTAIVKDITPAQVTEFADQVASLSFTMATLQEYIFRRRHAAGSVLADMADFRASVTKYTPPPPKYQTTVRTRAASDDEDEDEE